MLAQTNKESMPRFYLNFKIYVYISQVKPTHALSQKKERFICRCMHIQMYKSMCIYIDAHTYLKITSSISSAHLDIFQKLFFQYFHSKQQGEHPLLSGKILHPLTSADERRTVSFHLLIPTYHSSVNLETTLFLLCIHMLQITADNYNNPYQTLTKANQILLAEFLLFLF